MAQSPYQLINLTTDITLSWPSSFTGGLVVEDINDVTTTVDNWMIILPDATLVSNGYNMVFNNVSGFSFYIVANDASTIISHVMSGDVLGMYLINNSTSNGTWRVVPFGGGTNSITSFTATSSDGSVLITNGTVSPPTGIIDFELNDSLFNLYTVNATKFLVITDTNPLEFVTRELVGTPNILITDGGGIDNNPIIDLSTALTGIASIEVGNMTLSGEVITNNVVDGNIQLNTNGTGAVQINGVTISTSGNISGITNLVAPKAYCTFTDVVTGLANTIIVENQVNVTSVEGSAGTYVINLTTPMPSIEYGVFLTLGSTGGSLPFVSNAYYIAKDLSTVTIIVTDASGELVLSVPHGISVMLISS